MLDNHESNEQKKYNFKCMLEKVLKKILFEFINDTKQQNKEPVFLNQGGTIFEEIMYKCVFKFYVNQTNKQLKEIENFTSSEIHTIINGDFGDIPLVLINATQGFYSIRDRIMKQASKSSTNKYVGDWLSKEAYDYFVTIALKDVMNEDFIDTLMEEIFLYALACTCGSDYIYEMAEQTMDCLEPYKEVVIMRYLYEMPYFDEKDMIIIQELIGINSPVTKQYEINEMISFEHFVDIQYLKKYTEDLELLLLGIKMHNAALDLNRDVMLAFEEFNVSQVLPFEHEGFKEVMKVFEMREDTTIDHAQITKELDLKKAQEENNKTIAKIIIGEINELKNEIQSKELDDIELLKQKNLEVIINQNQTRNEVKQAFNELSSQIQQIEQAKEEIKDTLKHVVNDIQGNTKEMSNENEKPDPDNREFKLNESNVEFSDSSINNSVEINSLLNYMSQKQDSSPSSNMSIEYNDIEDIEPQIAEQQEENYESEILPERPKANYLNNILDGFNMEFEDLDEIQEQLTSSKSKVQLNEEEYPIKMEEYKNMLNNVDKTIDILNNEDVLQSNMYSGQGNIEVEDGLDFDIYENVGDEFEKALADVSSLDIELDHREDDFSWFDSDEDDFLMETLDMDLDDDFDMGSGIEDVLEKFRKHAK